MSTGAPIGVSVPDSETLSSEKSKKFTVSFLSVEHTSIVLLQSKLELSMDVFAQPRLLSVCLALHKLLALNV